MTEPRALQALLSEFMLNMSAAQASETKTITIPESYGAERLRKLGLTAVDGFRVDEGGDSYQSGTDSGGKPIYQKTTHGGIAIRYHWLDGEPVSYITPRFRQLVANRRGMGSDIEPRRYYERIRLTPQDERTAGRKYSSPSNTETNHIGNIAFLPLQVRQLCQAAQQLQNLTITEGEIKAAVAAKNYGIPTIAFAGISVFRLTDEVRQLIKTTKPRTVTILPDSDAVRDNGTDGEYFRRYNFFSSFVTFARDLFDFQTETGIHFDVVLCIPTGTGGKGLDDILLCESEAAAAYKSGIDSRFFTFYRVCIDSFVSVAETVFRVYRKYWKHTEGTFLHGKDDEHLTDILIRNGIPITAAGICGKQWNVPTGTGKTYLSAQLAKVAKVVLCVPTTILAESIASKYGAVLWIGKQKDARAKSAQFIVCNYKSFQSLFGVINSKEYNLFIDEIHNTAADIYHEPLSYIAERAELFASITTLTGTPFPQFCKAFQLPQLNVTSPKEAKRFYLYHCKEVRKSAAELFKKSLAAGRIPVVILNDTSTTGKLGSLLALLQDTAGISTLNSYTKETEEFQSIVKERRLHKSTVGIITTSILKEGNDIDDEKPFDFIVIGNHHVNDLEQFANRSRNGTDVAVYWLRSSKANNKNCGINVHGQAAEYITYTQPQIEILNNTRPTVTDSAPSAWYETIRNLFERFPIKKTVTGYELDGLRLTVALFRMEQSAMCANVELYCERLAKLGYEVHRETVTSNLGIQPFKIELESSKPDRAAIKAAKASAKEIELEEVEKIITHINNIANVHIIMEESKSSTLSKEKKILYSSYIKLVEVCSHSAAIVHLKRDGISKAKIRDTLQRAALHRILIDGNELWEKRYGFAVAIFAVYTKLQTNKPYTPASLYTEFIDCLNLNSLFNFRLRNGRQDAVRRLLRLFFNVSNKTGKRDGIVSKYIVLQPIDTAALLGIVESDICVDCLADDLQDDFPEIVPF